MAILQDAKQHAMEGLNAYSEYVKERKSKFYGEYEEAYEDIFKGDKRLSIFEQIKKFSKKNPRFKSDFVESVTFFLDSKGYITSNQYNGILKTYYSFKMNEEDYD
jgi:hypothetical protein